VIVESGRRRPVSASPPLDDSKDEPRGPKDAAQEVAADHRWLDGPRGDAARPDKRLRTVQPFTARRKRWRARPGSALRPRRSMTPSPSARPLVGRSRPRRAVVVITDGVDTASVMSPRSARGRVDDVLFTSSRSGCVDRIGRSPMRQPAAAASSQANLTIWPGGPGRPSQWAPCRDGPAPSDPDRAAAPVFDRVSPAPGRCGTR
jgi:hypothetical protein